MKYLKLFPVLIVIIAAQVLSAKPIRLKADQSQSFITYKLTHPLHEVESTSKKAICYIDADTASKEIKDVAVQVYVNTFDSGNSNRDSHAMEVIDALKYPYARFVSSSVRQKGDSLYATGKLFFHGVTKEITVKALSKWSNGKLEVDGGFNISLTAFRIKRPSLLLIPVNDTLKFTLVQVFNI